MNHVIKIIFLVGIFAVAMAYLESTIVVYLRHIYGINDLIADLPTSPDKYTTIEIGLELCTLIMLAIVGWVAGHSWPAKVGFAIFAFGVWDIFYYFWLIIFLGWPVSFFDWDILVLSISIALFIFMEDAIKACPEGIEAIGMVRPSIFN